MKLRLTCLALLSTTMVPGCQERSPSPPTELTPISVVTIGASLASGTSSFIADVNDDSEAFDDIYMYQDVLKELEPSWEIETFANMMFFSKPKVRGQETLDEALASPRRVVLALDYLFWFCYGDTAEEDGISRLALLQNEGIPRLEQLWADLPAGTSAPFVLVGTLPDVRNSTVLGASQLPSDEELIALNEAIVAWADQHPHVLIVPFADRFAALQEGGEAQIGQRTFTQSDLPKLMLSDKLHPSTQGAALIAALCLEAVAAAGDSGRALIQSDPSKIDPRAIAEKLMSTRKAARLEAEAAAAPSGQ